MNIHHVITAFVGASLFASAAVAQEKTVRSFKPASPWAMEYADHTCRLIRNFSDGTDSVTLAFEKSLPGAALTLGLAGKSLRVVRNAAIVRFRYNEDKSARASTLLKTVLTDGRDSLLIMNVPFLPADRMLSILKRTKRSERMAVLADIEMEAASRTTSIALSYGFLDDPEFAIGPMAAPLEAMRACLDNLLKSWGIDPQRTATLSRAAEPVASPRSWLSIADYPDDMWRAHRGGIVPVRLVIDEAGAVKDCIVTVEKRGPFEDAVCKAISSRASFKPALDADGKPMRSYWAQVVSFLPY